MLSSGISVDFEVLGWCVGFLCFRDGRSASVASSPSAVSSISTPCLDYMTTYGLFNHLLLYIVIFVTEEAAFILVAYRLCTSKIAVSIEQLAALPKALCLAAGC